MSDKLNSTKAHGDMFMNFLAKLESVAPRKDRATIDKVRGMYMDEMAKKNA